MTPGANGGAGHLVTPAEFGEWLDREIAAKYGGVKSALARRMHEIDPSQDDSSYRRHLNRIASGDRNMTRPVLDALASALQLAAHEIPIPSFQLFVETELERINDRLDEARRAVGLED